MPDADPARFYEVHAFGPPRKRLSNPVKCERYSPSSYSGLSLICDSTNDLVKKITSDQARLSRLLAANETDEQIVEQFFLAAFQPNRQPQGMEASEETPSRECYEGKGGFSKDGAGGHRLGTPEFEVILVHPLKGKGGQ